MGSADHAQTLQDVVRVVWPTGQRAPGLAHLVVYPRKHLGRCLVCKVCVSVTNGSFAVVKLGVRQFEWNHTFPQALVTMGKKALRVEGRGSHSVTCEAMVGHGAEAPFCGWACLTTMCLFHQ